MSKIINSRVRLTFNPDTGDSGIKEFDVTNMEFWQGGIFGLFEKRGWLFVPYDKVQCVQGVRVLINA